MAHGTSKHDTHVVKKVFIHGYFSPFTDILFEQRGEDFDNRCLARTVRAKQGK
jgi:hypothetical protein